MSPEAIIMELVRVVVAAVPGLIAEWSGASSDAEAVASLRARLEARRPAAERLRDAADARRQELRRGE